jgi:hypothetical protein
MPSPFVATAQIGPTLGANTTGTFNFSDGQQYCIVYVELIQGVPETNYVWVSADPNNYFTPVGNNEMVTYNAGPQEPLYWKIQLPRGVKLSFYIGAANVPPHNVSPRQLTRQPNT